MDEPFESASPEEMPHDTKPARHQGAVMRGRREVAKQVFRCRP
jgi:hypothetical protein